MFAWRRKLPASSVVAFLLAGACAVGAFVLVAGSARGADAGGTTVTVVAAARDLAPGVTLVEDDLTLLALPAATVPGSALRDPAEAVGRLAVTPFGAGEPVTTTRLALPGGPLTATVPPGQVAVPLQPDQAPTGVGGGDRVDVYATFLTARPYTATVGEDLAVLSARAPATGGAAPSLVLLTDPVTASSLAEADAVATVTVAVRGFVPLP
jgi:Flp pilus assembly protein CpaB